MSLCYNTICQPRQCLLNTQKKTRSMSSNLEQPTFGFKWNLVAYSLLSLLLLLLLLLLLGTDRTSVLQELLATFPLTTNTFLGFFWKQRSLQRIMYGTLMNWDLHHMHFSEWLDFYTNSRDWMIQRVFILVYLMNSPLGSKLKHLYGHFPRGTLAQNDHNRKKKCIFKI